jgi:V8-like Glu-specific endopeptidase
MTQEERTMVAERKKWIGVALAWTALVSLASCVEPPQGELLDEQGEKLLNGTPTFERPEVGRISGCTATLVRPNIVITAAHCVDFRSRTTPGNYNTFTIDLGPGNSSSYPVDLIQVYSSGQLGEQDVALMRLSRARARGDRDADDHRGSGAGQRGDGDDLRVWLHQPELADRDLDQAQV